MGQFKKEIEDLNEKLEILIDKFISDETDKTQATEALKALYSCASLMDEVLEEVSTAGGNIDEIMDSKPFYATPDETVKALDKIEAAFHATRATAIRPQVVIKRDTFKTIFNQITLALDNIERQQLGDTSKGGQ
ncbi:MAG: hypothetical protein P1U32_08360 [Legionellaceae bacterium]|nr:hypothetical protein [Legionellaceae bacterium]